MLTIRLATLEDYKGINSVSRYLGYNELSNNQVKSKLDVLLHSDFDTVFVAESSHEIIGWLHLFRVHRLASNDFYEIGGLVVKPDYRGQGVAKSVIAHSWSGLTEFPWMVLLVAD